MADKLKMYGHAACPQVILLKAWLDRKSLDYHYINIREDRQAAQIVREINHGDESVPTLVFPDGSSLTEPSLDDVRKKLSTFCDESDQVIPPSNYLWPMTIGSAILLGILRLFGMI